MAFHLRTCAYPLEDRWRCSGHSDPPNLKANETCWLFCGWPMDGDKDCVPPRDTELITGGTVHTILGVDCTWADPSWELRADSCSSKSVFWAHLTIQHRTIKSSWLSINLLYWSGFLLLCFINMLWSSCYVLFIISNVSNGMRRRKQTKADQ